jgi:pilus assembly protein TadC
MTAVAVLLAISAVVVVAVPAPRRSATRARSLATDQWPADARSTTSTTLRLATSTVAGALQLAGRRRRLRAQRSALVDDLPDVVDLFRVAAGGGLTVHLSIEAVARVVDGPTRAALDEVRRRVSLGERLVDALAGVAELGEPARPLVAALVSAERDGASLAGPLARAADHARDIRRRHAEEVARRVPIRLLFPLVGCVLPAFALLTVVPLLAGIVQNLPL